MGSALNNKHAQTHPAVRVASWAGRAAAEGPIRHLSASNFRRSITVSS